MRQNDLPSLLRVKRVGGAAVTAFPLYPPKADIRVFVGQHWK